MKFIFCENYFHMNIKTILDRVCLGTDKIHKASVVIPSAVDGLIILATGHRKDICKQ